MSTHFSPEVVDSLFISKQLQPKLRGLGPEMQGAILADLVGIFFAGINPKIRERLITEWMECMRELMKISEEKIVRSGQNWEDGFRG